VPEPPATSPTADAAATPAGIGDQVTAALGLGRQMTELLAAVGSRVPATPEDTDPTEPTDPTTLGPLVGDQLFHLRLLAVHASLYRMRAISADSGIPMPTTDDLLASESTLAGPTGCGAVATLHAQIMEALTASMPSMGSAYELGSALAALCESTSEQPGALSADFDQGRVDRIRDLLAQLQSILPAHSAQAVIGALNNWEDWLRAGMIGKLAIRADRDSTVIALTLGAQGAEWFSLLDGQKDAIDLLSADDYVDAGEALLRQYLDLGKRFVIQFWPYLLIGLCVVASIVILLYNFGHGDTKGVGTIATLLASLGLTAKAATSTLEKTASNLEDSLWQAELDSSIIFAATSLPGGMTPVVTPTIRPFAHTQRMVAQKAIDARNQAITARATKAGSTSTAAAKP